MKQSKTAYIYLALTILLWSATPAVSKIALGELDNFQLLFYTSICSVVSLFLVNFAKGNLHSFSSYTKKDALVMFGMGFVGVYLYYILIFGSYALAPAGQVNVVNYLWPIFVVIFSIPILKEKFNWKTIAAVLVGFLGAFIAFTKGDFSFFSNQYAFAYLLAALGAVCYGLFSVIGKKLKYEKFGSMLAYYISAAILIIPTTMIVSSVKIPTLFSTVLSIILLGGLINSIGWVCWFKALEFGNTHKIANMVFVVPFLAMVWTYILNGEQISVYSVVGLSLIILGIVIQLRNKV